MGDARQGMNKAIGKGWTRLLLAVVGLVLVYGAASLVFSLWPFNIVARVASADAMIYSYEKFYDLKTEIDAARINYQVAKKAGMVEAPGMLMVLNRMIAEYNSDSMKITKNLWKAADLPYQIDLEMGE